MDRETTARYELQSLQEIARIKRHNLADAERLVKSLQDGLTWLDAEIERRLAREKK